MSISVFTGLVPETPSARAAWSANQINLPPMASEVKETLFADPPAWMPIENQRATNMCAAHAGTSCMEKLAFIAQGEFVQLSRNYLYLRGQQECGLTGDVGCTLGGIIAAMKKRGDCPEEMWPFRGTAERAVPRGCDEAAKAYKATITIDVETGGYDAARTVIGQNIGSVLLATLWPLQLSNGYIVEGFNPRGRGGHALAGLFLSTKSDSQGRPYVWVANSHSVDSGKQGWMLWSPQAVDACLRGGGWGATGITDLSTPKPRKVNWSGRDNPFAK